MDCASFTKCKLLWVEEKRLMRCELLNSVCVQTLGTMPVNTMEWCTRELVGSSPISCAWIRLEWGTRPFSSSRARGAGKYYRKRFFPNLGVKNWFSRKGTQKG